MSGDRKRPVRLRVAARLDRAFPIVGMVTIFPGGLVEVRPRGCRRKWDLNLADIVQAGVEKAIRKALSDKRMAKKASRVARARMAR